MELKIDRLTKQYGAKIAVDRISLTLTPGVTGLLGANGAGKTTLMRMLCGILKPTSGTVSFDGVDVSAEAYRRVLGYLPQDFGYYPNFTGLDFLLYLSALKGLDRRGAEARSRELLELVGLPDKADAYPAQLSGGQQQRVAIARALAAGPKVLLCDEATSALDPKTTHAILELIRDINRKLGITVILITHQMSVVEEICNRVAILDQGAVVEEGEVGAVFARPRSDAARRLVFPDGAEEILAPHPEERRLRVVFHGAPTTRTPLIARMAMEERIAANILSASTRSIGDKVYGNMLLSISGSAEQALRATAYLRSIPDIIVEEVDSHA